MSDATVRPGGSAHPTRQQLDDLEALMERMLALPVKQGADEPAAEFPTVTAETGPAGRDQSEPAGEEESSWQPVMRSVETVVSEPPAASEPAKPQAAREGPSVGVIPGPFPGMMRPAVLGRLRPKWPRWLAPVLWINRTFDAWTARMGRPGRWLRSRQGRALLGALGLLFLTAAVGWTILGLVGWTW